MAFHSYDFITFLAMAHSYNISLLQSEHICRDEPKANSNNWATILVIAQTFQISDKYSLNEQKSCRSYLIDDGVRQSAASKQNSKFSCHVWSIWFVFLSWGNSFGLTFKRRWWTTKNNVEYHTADWAVVSVHMIYLSITSVVGCLLKDSTWKFKGNCWRTHTTLFLI